MHTRKLQRNAMKAAAVICAAAVFISAPAFPALAQEVGPGVTPITGSGQTGPGVTGGVPVIQDNPSNYYHQPMASPVVEPEDKYSYEQMTADIQELERLYGSHMSVNVIGTSADGKNIYDIVVGSPKASHNLMIQAGIHGREYITVSVLMKQLEQMLAGFDSGTYNGRRLSSILSDTAIHFLPMTNPDGIAVSQLGESGLSSQDLKDTLKEAYAADTADGRTSLPYESYLILWKNNGRGVDLNHNFAKEWDSLNGAMNHISFADYKGTAPLSEPEAAALARLTEQVNFDACINYHAMGEVIYWDTADNLASEASLQLAQSVSGITGYQILGSLGRGGLKDWLQARKPNPVPGITVEMGKTSCPVNFAEFDSIMSQTQAIPAAAAYLVATWKFK